MDGGKWKIRIVGGDVATGDTNSNWSLKTWIPKTSVAVVANRGTENTLVQHELSDNAVVMHPFETDSNGQKKTSAV